MGVGMVVMDGGRFEDTALGLNTVVVIVGCTVVVTAAVGRGVGAGVGVRVGAGVGVGVGAGVGKLSTSSL
jgi:hypothetical protein